MAGAFVLGFDSSIATTLNVFPQLGLGILKSVLQDGDVEEAKNQQEKLNRAIEIVTKNGRIVIKICDFYDTIRLFLGGWVETMKEAMSLLTPINCGPPRDPLVRLTPSHIKEMEAELKLCDL